MRVARNILLAVLHVQLLLVALSPFLVPVSVQAQTRPWVEINSDCVGEDGKGAVSSVTTTDVPTIKGIECLVANLLSIGVSVVGIASFVMFLIGGLLYLFSGGQPKWTELGSKTMTYAFFGIVTSVSGWIIINFLSIFTGIESIKVFNLSVPEP